MSDDKDEKDKKSFRAPPPSAPAPPIGAGSSSGSLRKPPGRTSSIGSFVSAGSFGSMGKAGSLAMTSNLNKAWGSLSTPTRASPIAMATLSTEDPDIELDSAAGGGDDGDDGKVADLPTPPEAPSAPDDGNTDAGDGGDGAGDDDGGDGNGSGRESTSSPPVPSPPSNASSPRPPPSPTGLTDGPPGDPMPVSARKSRRRTDRPKVMPDMPGDGTIAGGPSGGAGGAGAKRAPGTGGPFPESSWVAEKRLGFVGRDWLFDEVDTWLSGSNSRTKSSPGLLITAPSGWGKSAFAAELIARWGPSRVAGHLYCRIEDADSLTLHRALRRLAASVALNVPGYAQALKNPAIWNAISKNNAALDPFAALSEGLVKPLCALPVPEEHVSSPMVIVVDGLSESLHSRGSDAMQTSSPEKTRSVLHAVAQMMNVLPKWIKLICFSQPVDPKVRAVLHGMTVLDQSPGDDDNMADLAAHVEEACTRRGIPESIEPLKTKIQLARNMAFVSFAVEALSAKVFDAENFDVAISGSLHSLYVAYLRVRWPKGKRDFKGIARTIVNVLLATFEPMTASAIASVTNVDEDVVKDTLEGLTLMLRRAGGPGSAVSWAHSSVWDFFAGDAARKAGYQASERKGHQHMFAAGFRAYGKSTRSLPLYHVRHLPHHTHLARKAMAFRRLLFDYVWLHRKLELLQDPTALWWDFNYYPAQLKLVKYVRHLVAINKVRGAIQASVRALSADHTQLAAQLAGHLAYTQGKAIRGLLMTSRWPKRRHWFWPAKVWFAAPNEEVDPLPRDLLREDSVKALSIAPNGSLVAVGSLNTNIKVYNMTSGAHVSTIDTLHDSVVTGLSWSRNGAWLVSSSWDSYLGVAAVETSTPVHKWRYHAGFINGVASTVGDRDKAVTVGDDGKGFIVDLDSGETRKLAGHEGLLTAVTMSSNYLATGGWDRTIKVWDFAGNLIVNFEGHLEAVVGLDCAGELIASVGVDRTLRLWNVTKQKLHRTWYMSSRPNAVRFLPGGRFVVTVSDNGGVEVWDTRGERVTSFHAGVSMTAVDARMTPRGLTVVAGDVHGHVYWLDLIEPGKVPVKAPGWVDDKSSPVCTKCETPFTFFNRRHHCRYCGGLFCGNCSSETIELPFLGYPTPVRVCDLDAPALKSTDALRTVVPAGADAVLAALGGEENLPPERVQGGAAGEGYLAEGEVPEDEDEGPDPNLVLVDDDDEVLSDE